MSGDAETLQELQAYVRKWARGDLMHALRSWTGRNRGLIIGEWHPGLESSLELIEALAASGRFEYWATEYFTRSALAELWGFVFRYAPIALSPEKSQLVKRRWAPVLATAQRLRRRGFPVLRIGTTALKPARDAEIAARFKEEVEERKIPLATPGLLQLGAAHASRVPYDGNTSTTRQALEKSGWPFASACVVTMRTAEGWPADPKAAMFRLSPGDDSLYPLFSLISSSTQAAAIPLRRRWRSSRSGPFHLIRPSGSTSGRSIADQYEYLVLIR